MKTTNHRTALTPVAALLLLLTGLAFAATAGDVHDAARDGKVDRLKELITADPALVRATNATGDTPLNVAAIAGRPEVVELLLAAKAEVNHPNRYGSTALILASGLRFLSEDGSVAREIIASQSNAIAAVTNRLPNAKALLIDSTTNAMARMQQQLAASLEELAARLTCVEHLLKAGATVRATNHIGLTALHNAAMSPSGSVARRLLHAGAPVDALDLGRRTPLHAAAIFQMPDAAAALLDGGAALEPRDIMGLTPLFYSHSMRTNVTPTFRLLLQRGASANTVNARGDRLLSVAAGVSAGEAVQLLLHHGAEVNSKSGEMRATALHTAAGRGDTPILAVLLKAGAEVDARDKVGATPLYDAAEKGRPEAARLLLDHKADPNRMATGLQLRTPLHAAAANGNLDVVQLLIERGARLHTLTVEDASALHEAVLQGHVRVVEFLLAKGADPSAAGKGFHSTPLSLALTGRAFNLRAIKTPAASTHFHEFGSEEDYQRVTELLLKHGATVNDRDAMGRTPLFIAAEASNQTAVTWLLERKADLQAKDKFSRGVLAGAAIGNSQEIIRQLVQAGADLLARAEDNRSVMHNAAEFGQPESIKTLHELGLGVGIRDANGATPLHWAAMIGRTAAVKMLLQLGADVNAVDRFSQTPLYMAAQMGQPEALEALLEARADASLRHTQGNTPFGIARQLGKTSVLAVFKRHLITE